MSNKIDSFNVNEAKWYIVRVHSGSEYKVVDDIKKNADLYKVADDDFTDFFVPSVTIESFRKNVKSEVKKNLYPGYIVIKMKMNERSWLAVTKTDKVSGFLGGTRGKPIPLTETEYQEMVNNATQGAIAASNANSILVGSRIKVKSGSFESFEGVVKSVDEKNSMLTVSVSIFDRETTIELTPNQVEIVHRED